MSDSDDIVILTPPTSQKGFKGHLLISSERIKREPGVQVGMVSPSQPSASNQPGLSVPILNSNPRPAPSGGLRAPAAPRHHAPVVPAGPRLNPALQNPNLYFRSINPREQLEQAQQQQQQLQSQQQSQQQQLQQSSAAKNALGQAVTAAMPRPQQGQLPGQPAASFVINSGGSTTRIDQNAAVLLDSRLILSHVSPLENNDSHQILNQIKYPHEAAAIIKCIECCDQFYFRHCYQHHRERQVVSITYNCEICARKMFFYNKCALFAHVRTHKLGSVDPSKLTICSLPLARMKTLSETSLKQLVTQLDQAHAKYQEALKALNSCLPPGSQQQVSAFGGAAAAAAIAGSLPSVSGASATAPGPSGANAAAHSAGSSAVVPITIDLEEGAVPGCDLPGATEAGADGGGGGNALDANALVGAAAESATVSSSGVADSKDAGAVGGGGNRPTAVVEPAVVQAAVVTSGAGDSALPDLASGPSAQQPQHHHQRQQSCTVCQGSFDSLAAHLGDSLKECPLCKKFVPESRCALKAHYRLHLAVPGPCPECGEVVAPSGASQLEREVAMRVHLRSQCLHLQRSKVFICLKCEYPPRAFSAIRQLADHIIHSHTEKFFKCTVCTLAFRHTNQLSVHLEKEHSSQLSGKPAKIFKCPICDLIFNDSGNLGKHLLSHLPNQQFCKSAMAFRCLDSCRQIFLEKKGLKRHLNTCQSTAVTGTNLPCVLCEINVSFFNSLAELRSHEETHLNSTAGGWCPNCETEVEANLLDHLRQEQKRLENKDQPQQQSSPPPPPPPPPSQPQLQQQKSQARKLPPKPQQKPVFCHCGQELPDAAAVAKHMEKAVHHPITTESHITEPQSGVGVFYKCRDCPMRLTYTELTEHIFAEHPALCYLCNAAQLTAAHLHCCLTTGRMEGLLQSDSETAAAAAAAVAEAADAAAAAASASNDDDAASEGAASSNAGSASASGGAASTSASAAIAVQFCPLCLDPVDGPADLQRHTAQRHGRPAGFKRPAERDLQKPDGVKVARTSGAEAATDAADTAALVPAPAAAGSGLACSECGMRFLTRSALQVHRLATRHDL